MRDSQYTIVLGAGASAPYGYPVGRTLVDRMVGLTKEQVNGTFHLTCDEILAGIELSSNPLPLFQNKLRRSRMDSIDVFLGSVAQEPELQRLGKFLIAAFLLPLESEEPVAACDDWYRWFINRLYAVFGDLSTAVDSAEINFITYNYDTSLERVLRGTFRAAGVSADRIDGWLRRHVLHVHGQLAGMPLGLRGSLWRSQDPSYRLRMIQESMESIRVIHQVDRYHESNTIRHWLESANTIIFLGFGYQEQNCSKLFAEVRKLDAAVYASGFGLLEQERHRAEALLLRYGRIDQDRLRIGARDMPNEVFLREVVPFF